MDDFSKTPVNSETYNSSPEELPVIESFLDKVQAQEQILGAQDLGRSGEYQKAEEILKSIKQWGTYPEILDLLARNYAQQGRLEEAKSCWQKALTLDPTNLSYQRGMAYLAGSKPAYSRLGWSLHLLFRGMVVVFFAGVIILSWIWLGSLGNTIDNVTNSISEINTVLTSIPKNSSSLATPVVTINPVISIEKIETTLKEITTNMATLQNGQNLVLTQIASLENKQDNLFLQLEPTVRPFPHIAIDLNGVSTLTVENRMIIYFDEDLFVDGWKLSLQAKTLVSQVGQTLEPYANQINISLIGFSSAEEDSNYFALGLMRSVVVLDYLERSTQLPEERFLIQSAESLNFLPSSDLQLVTGHQRSVIMIIQSVQ